MRASRLQGWELRCRVGVGGHATVCVRSQGSLSSLSGGGAEICKRRAALTTGAHLCAGAVSERTGLVVVFP